MGWLCLLRFVCEADLALDHAQIFFLELILVLCLRYGFLGSLDLLFELFNLVVLALTLLLAQIHSAGDVCVILISFVYFGLLPLNSQLQLVNFVLVDSLLVSELRPLLVDLGLCLFLDFHDGVDLPLSASDARFYLEHLVADVGGD